MEPIRKLPDPRICRTSQLFDTSYYLCLVEDPISCPQLNMIRDTNICNHYLRRNFSMAEPSHELTGFNEEIAHE